MTILFQEPGSQATGDLSLYTSTTGTVATDTGQFRIGSRSIKCTCDGSGNPSYAQKDGVLSSVSGRFSVFAMPNVPDTGRAFIRVLTAANATCFHIFLNQSSGTQATVGISNNTVGISAAGGVSNWRIDDWNRFSCAYTLTSTTDFTIKVWVNGRFAMQVTQADYSLPNVVAANIRIGWNHASAAAAMAGKILYFEDVYIDDGAGLDEPGGTGVLGVTAKRPAADNTIGFDTSIGTDPGVGLRYTQVDDVPTDQAKGRQHAAQTDAQENYTLEGRAAGDVDLTQATVIGRTAWMLAKRGTITPCTHRASAASGSVNPTTSMTITIPASTATNDALFCCVTSRDHTSGTALPTCTDNDAGGNTWTLIANSTDRVLTLFYKRATSATASKTITVSGCVGSCSGGVSVFQAAATAVNPYTNVSAVADNASGTEQHATFTPDIDGSSYCIAIANYNNDNTVSSVSGATVGAFTSGYEKLSTGGSDCGNTIWYVTGTDAAKVASGLVTWAQTNGVTHSVVWAVRPVGGLGTPKIMDNGSETTVDLTTTASLFTVTSISATYPSDAAGIGARSGGSDAAADTLLYDCGTIVSYLEGPRYRYLNINQAVNRASSY